MTKPDDLLSSGYVPPALLEGGIARLLSQRRGEKALKPSPAAEMREP
jgi:hypothetical protein